MGLNTTSFFNSNEVHISSRMNEYMKKNFGYEVKGDIDELQEAKKSLEAEQIELRKHSYMNGKYMENMLMIETINSLVKAHGVDIKEGSFWGRDDMVAQMKRDELAAGMRKYTKDTDGASHGTTTSDPEEWKRLEADGYVWDKDYYKDVENEAYNPETGRDPNVDTTEWDELIAKARKKQGISDEEEIWFNYGDIGGNIIVNPKSTIEDQIAELLSREPYNISAMEFDPSKIEITTPDQTNQDAEDEEEQHRRDVKHGLYGDEEWAESLEEDDYDDGKLRLDPTTGKYDPEEVKQMQQQGAEMARQKANQNMRDKLNRDIDVSQKAHTITVEYDLELDTPKSKNPLLKKHYQLMKKFNVFISMPHWEEGPKDSGFGQWFADVRGSKENLKGWLKAWEYDYDERDYEDMGLEESQLDEFGPDERYLKVGNTTTIANKKTGSVSSNLNLGGDKNVRVNNHFNKDGSQGKVTASGTVGGMKFKASNQANFKTPKASVNGVNIPLNASKKRKVKEDDEMYKRTADAEKGPEHYRWKNDSQLAVVIGRIEGAIDELDNAIQYRGENSAKFFNNGDKAGVGGLMGIKQKLEDIHSEWDKNTEYYGM